MRTKPPNLPVSEKKIVDVLKKYHVRDAAVFGSFSRGDADEESDLDLLVTYGPRTSLFDTFDLREELERVTGRKVDLVSKPYIKERLAKRIKGDIKPLHFSS